MYAILKLYMTNVFQVSSYVDRSNLGSVSSKVILKLFFRGASLWKFWLLSISDTVTFISNSVDIPLYSHMLKFTLHVHSYTSQDAYGEQTTCKIHKTGVQMDI